MNLILFLVTIMGFIILLSQTLYMIVIKGNYWYLLIFLIFYLSSYITFQTIAYQQIGHPEVVNLIRIIKDAVILITLFLFIFSQPNIFKYKFQFTSTDIFFIVFITICTIFLILPIGSSGITDKLIYYKNIIIPAFIYFLGRNMILGDKQKSSILNAIVIISIAAFCLSSIEYLFNQHFHSIIGYGRFNDDINRVNPSGHFGLAWTFETSSGRARYAAFFANPLELASASLLAFATAFIFFIKSTSYENKLTYFLVIIMIICSMYFAFSRASMIALVLQMIFISVLFKYNKLLMTGAFSVILIVIYIVYFASDDLRYFIIDTLTFENASSFGHLVEWADGIESMISFPMGIGLAMSGNAGGVDDSVRVGGENQYIIYGVQLGIIGMIVYVALLVSAIRKSIKAYKIASTKIDQMIPFIAATTKFGLLLPLFTANVELYLYVSYISWWMVGQSVSEYSKYRRKERLIPAL